MACNANAGGAKPQQGARRDIMTSARFPIAVTENYVEANGINIWYAEAGQGVPLLLLHGGIVSNGPLWADSAYGWGGHVGRFAEHFRVIAPDTRGHGRTLNPSGVLSYPVFAEDVIALTRALHLEKPFLCGFSDGGITAAVVGIMAPDLPRAIVNLAGLDMFDPDPESRSRIMNRTWLGGDPHATKAKSTRLELPPAMEQKVIADFEPTQGMAISRPPSSSYSTCGQCPWRSRRTIWPRPPRQRLFLWRTRYRHSCWQVRV